MSDRYSRESLTKLTEILNEISLDILKKAYRSSLPEVSHRSIPSTLETMLQKILDLPGDAHLAPPLHRFICHLIQDKSVNLQCRQNLQGWAEERDICVRETTQTPPKNLEIYLTIEVKQHSLDKYLVSAAIVTDPNPLAIAVQTIAQKIDIPTAPDPKYLPGYSQAQLPHILNDLIAICGSEHSIPLSDLNVRWFLPTKLMNLPIDHWQIQTGKNQRHYNGKRCKSAVVCCTDRYLNDYRAVLGEWKNKWQFMLDGASSTCDPILDDLDADEIENILGCRFIAYADPQEQEDYWDEFLSYGLPIALWCRQPAAELSVMDTVINNCKLVDLPNSLSKHRKSIFPKTSDPILDCQHNAHLSLLWDNPFRPFPTINYQSH